MVDGTVTETPDQNLLAKGLGRVPPRGWRWLRLLFSAIWLIYLAQPLSTLSGNGHSVGWQATAIAVTVAFCVVFIIVVTQWDERPALARWNLWALFALAAAFNLMFRGPNVGGGVVWIYVSSAVGWAVPDRKWAVRAVFGVAACYLFIGWLGHDDISDMLITLIPVVFVGITMSGFRVQMKLMWELRQAREDVAKHAASEERLRLARDMHDLTGQSLSMITLKSELAARLLERLPEGPDRDRVADEIQQVAAVSRQTLHDIREALSGYRRPTLAVEIITARSALESAGIAPHDDSELTLLSGTFDPDAEAALAWCLREAVTNVIRHSGAENCFIRLIRHDETQTLSLQVRDDGRGCPGGNASGEAADPAGEAGSPAEIPAGTGTGLHGMSERLCAVGGGLELRPGAQGFCLVATVPVAPVVSAPAGVTVTT
jgi:two-component system sensor histidine kinase DesK